MPRTITYPISNIIFLLAIKSNQRRRCLAARRPFIISLLSRDSARKISETRTTRKCRKTRWEEEREREKEREKEEGGRTKSGDALRRQKVDVGRNQVNRVYRSFSLISQGAHNAIPATVSDVVPWLQPTSPRPPKAWPPWTGPVFCFLCGPSNYIQIKEHAGNRPSFSTLQLQFFFFSFFFFFSSFFLFLVLPSFISFLPSFSFSISLPWSFWFLRLLASSSYCYSRTYDIVLE